MALAHPCVFPIALGALVALFPLFGVPDGFIILGNATSHRAASEQNKAVAPLDTACSWSEDYLLDILAGTIALLHWLDRKACAPCRRAPQGEIGKAGRGHLQFSRKSGNPYKIIK